MLTTTEIITLIGISLMLCADTGYLIRIIALNNIKKCLWLDGIILTSGVLSVGALVNDMLFINELSLKYLLILAFVIILMMVSSAVMRENRREVNALKNANILLTILSSVLFFVCLIIGGEGYKLVDLNNTLEIVFISFAGLVLLFDAVYLIRTFVLNIRKTSNILDYGILISGIGAIVPLAILILNAEEVGYDILSISCFALSLNMFSGFLMRNEDRNYVQIIHFVITVVCILALAPFLIKYFPEMPV